MAEVYLDATNTITGRLASHAAKQALLGNKIFILNCEKAMISGNSRYIHERYYKKVFDVGQPQRGPFISRQPERFLKRIIRGMLPHKRTRGRMAFKKIMCYRGVPTQFKDKKLEKVEKSEINKLPVLKYMQLGELCKKLGGRV
jgi:large subunit ribosomal protein L13